MGNIERDICFGHGTCDPQNGVCTCDSGYKGKYCEVSDSLLSKCSNIKADEDCQNGGVRVFDSESDECQWSCDCTARQRNAGFLSIVPHFWEGNRCQTCGLKCKNGATANAQCTKCTGCDKTKYGGDLCESTFWVGNFETDIEFNTIPKDKTEREIWDDTLMKDLSWALNDPQFTWK